MPFIIPPMNVFAAHYIPFCTLYALEFVKGAKKKEESHLNALLWITGNAWTFKCHFLFCFYILPRTNMNLLCQKRWSFPSELFKQPESTLTCRVQGTDSSHPHSCLNHNTKAIHLQPSRAGFPKWAGKESVKLLNCLLCRPRAVLLFAPLFLISIFGCNYKYCRKTHPSATCLSKSLMLVCVFNDHHYISPLSVQLYQEIKYLPLSPALITVGSTLVASFAI